MARRLLLLNGLATLGVVLNHASSWVYVSMFWWTDRYRSVSVPNFDSIGLPVYYLLRTLEQLIAFTVPSFLFVSGFFIAFIAGSQPLASRWTHATKRIGALLIPYAIWSTILLIDRYADGTRYSLMGYVRVYLFGRAAEPFYYIPLLCQCLLLAPFLIEAAKRNWRALLVTVGVLQIAVQALPYPGYLGYPSSAVDTLLSWNAVWILPGRIFWFTLGVVVALHLETFQAALRPVRWWCVGLAVLLVPVGVFEWEALRVASSINWIPYFDTEIDSLYAAAVICTVLAFSQLEPPLGDQIRALGKYSYGVYLAHSIVVAYGARAVAALTPLLLQQYLALYGFLVVAGLGVPLVAMVLLKQSRFKGSYRFVFG